MEPLTIDEQRRLLTDNNAEVMRMDIIDDILKSGRPLKIYWGGLPACLLACDFCERVNADVSQAPLRLAGLTAAISFQPSRLPSFLLRAAR